MLVRTATDNLVIPDDFIDRERNVLLRLKEDDPFDLFLLDRRQTHEAGKNHLLRDGVNDIAASDAQFSHHFAQCRSNLGGAHFFAR